MTLVMACAFMAGWARSAVVTDELRIPTRTHSAAALMSSGHSLLWITQETNGATEGDYPAVWMTVDSSDNLMTLEEIRWLWQEHGFGVGEWSFNELGNPSGKAYTITQTYRAVPYWTITIPLTLLSAYLILWQPRKRDSPKA